MSAQSPIIVEPDLAERDAHAGENLDEIEVDHTSERFNSALRQDDQAQSRRRPAQWTVLLLLPLLCMAAAGTAGYFKYVAASAATSTTAATEALAAARETTVAILTYQPDTVEQTLHDAQNRLTGEFRDEYTHLINDVVIPGARAGKVTSAAAVPAAAVVSAETERVVTLVYVDQHVTVGTEMPTDTATTVKVTLQREGSHWLVSGFEPV